jgi:hypothetical protein
MVLSQVNRLSNSDRMGILSYRDTFRSCKRAFAIVRKNRARIIRLAKSMTKTETKQSAPMPLTFPATCADFLRLVIATDDAAERYENFLSDRVKAHWAGGFLENYAAALPMRLSYFASFVNDELRAAHVGKTHGEISQQLFDKAFATALALERKRFELGFENREGWEFSARTFLTQCNQKAS